MEIRSEKCGAWGVLGTHKDTHFSFVGLSPRLFEVRAISGHWHSSADEQQKWLLSVWGWLTVSIRVNFVSELTLMGGYWLILVFFVFFNKSLHACDWKSSTAPGSLARKWVIVSSPRKETWWFEAEIKKTRPNKIEPNTFCIEQFPGVSIAIDCSLKEWTDHLSSRWAYSTKTRLWRWLFFLVSGDFSCEDLSPILNV